MDDMYWCFPFWYSSLSLLLYFPPLAPMTTSISILGDFSLRRDGDYFFSALTHALMVLASLSVITPSVFSKPSIFNKLFYYILLMDEIICVVVMTLVETIIFGLSHPWWFFDREEIPDSVFLKLSVHAFFSRLSPSKCLAECGNWT